MNAQPTKLIGYRIKEESAVPMINHADSNHSHDLGTTNNLAMLTLYDNGMINGCNRAGAELLGYAPDKLTWQHISKVLPQLGNVVLLQGERINPYLRFLSRVGHHFEVIGMGGVRFACELFFNEAENLSQHCLRIIIQPVTWPAH